MKALIGSRMARYRALVLAGAAAFAVVALVSHGRALSELLARYRAAPPRDFISVYETRFTEIKKRLPARGTVGYLADVPPEVYIHQVGDDAARFLFTQYALAPLIVVGSDEPDWIVGNFHKPETFRRIAAEGRYEVAFLHPARGVVLLRKRTP